MAHAINSYFSFFASPLWPALFSVFFAPLWCAAGFYKSLVSGWHALSRRFRAQSEPRGEVKTARPAFNSTDMRFWSHHGSVIRLIAAEDALYPSVFFLSRPGHPPLRIPWNQIQFGGAWRIWRNYVVLTLGSEEKIPMRISERMVRNLGILDRCPAA